MEQFDCVFKDFFSSSVVALTTLFEADSNHTLTGSLQSELDKLVTLSELPLFLVNIQWYSVEKSRLLGDDALVLFIELDTQVYTTSDDNACTTHTRSMSVWKAVHVYSALQVGCPVDKVNRQWLSMCLIKLCCLERRLAI